MTKEEKELMTKVLCEQLPYGVKIRIEYPFIEEKDWHPEALCGLDLRRQVIADTSIRIEEFKPYLRPLSSMTEEEEAELSNILPCGMSFSYTTKGELIIYTDCEGDNDHYFICFVEVQDFLNAHHFDFRGLIPKGLAIAAVGENNPYKEKGGEK